MVDVSLSRMQARAVARVCLPTFLAGRLPLLCFCSVLSFPFASKPYLIWILGANEGGREGRGIQLQLQSSARAPVNNLDFSS